MSSATDPYLKADLEYKMTQKFLELFAKYRFPVHIITKSERIIHDIPLLRAVDDNAIIPDDLKGKLDHGLIISFSISSIDEKITNMLEPGAIPPIERLKALQYLKGQNFLTGVNCMPLLPNISDSEEKIDEMIGLVKSFNADYVLAAGLTLFGNAHADSKTLYYKFLERYNSSFMAIYDRLYGNYPFPPKNYQPSSNNILLSFFEG